MRFFQKKYKKMFVELSNDIITENEALIIELCQKKEHEWFLIENFKKLLENYPKRYLENVVISWSDHNPIYGKDYIFIQLIDVEVHYNMMYMYNKKIIKKKIETLKNRLGD